MPITFEVVRSDTHIPVPTNAPRHEWLTPGTYVLGNDSETDQLVTTVKVLFAQGPNGADLEEDVVQVLRGALDHLYAELEVAP